jgi:DNA primase
VEEIKQKVDIVELVGSYVSLKHAGKYFKANCPFHQEKTPSFVVSPDIQRWHCFGACHEGGDIFNFIMKWERVSFGEALRILAERAGVPLTDQAKSSGYFDAEVDKRSKVFSINELAAKYYAYLLQTAESATVARAYLTERTLPEAIVKTFQIGYAPEAWTNLRDYMYKKNFQDQDLLATGLFVQGERGIYDRFRGRLMFPIQNTRGQVVGFSGRLIKEDISEKDGGKYINTPETLVYHKRESLYGFYHTKDEVRKSNTAIVVEGEFDMLTPYTKGITNIVAIKGSAFTEEQLKTLRRYCNRLILALDNDPAGFDALRKSTLDAQQFSFELYVCAIPEGKDPDEAARMNIGALKAAIRQPIPVYDHIINTLFTRVDENDPFSKKHFIEGAIPFIDMIENPIVRTHYIQKAAGLLK